MKRAQGGAYDNNCIFGIVNFGHAWLPNAVARFEAGSQVRMK